MSAPVHYLRTAYTPPRARILPRSHPIWSNTCQDYVTREEGEPIRAIRLARQIPQFLACVGGVGLLCAAIIISSRVIG